VSTHNCVTIIPITSGSGPPSLPHHDPPQRSDPSHLTTLAGLDAVNLPHSSDNPSHKSTLPRGTHLRDDHSLTTPRLSGNHTVTMIPNNPISTLLPQRTVIPPHASRKRTHTDMTYDTDSAADVTHNVPPSTSPAHATFSPTKWYDDLLLTPEDHPSLTLLASFPLPQIITDIITAHRRHVRHAVLPPPELSTTTSICSNYDTEMYTAISQDTRRNAAYNSDIRSLPLSPQPRAFLDIGTGAEALLTRMAIARFPCSRFIATDVNPLSASAASTLLTQSYPATDTTVLVGASAVPLTPQVLRSVPADIRVLHELFGSFASSEGAPLALSEVRSALMAAGKTPTFAPQVAATFVTPVF
jgi:hypothetical protein